MMFITDDSYSVLPSCRGIQGESIFIFYSVLRANLGIPETKGYEVVPLRNDESGKSRFTTLIHRTQTFEVLFTAKIQNALSR